MGFYVVTAVLASDSTDDAPDDNKRDTIPMIISLDTLANSSLPPYTDFINKSSTISSASFTGATDGLRLANFMSINKTKVVNGVYVFLARSRVNSSIVASIRDTTGIFANFSQTLQSATSLPSLVTSDPYVLPSTAGNRMVFIPFPDTLSSGTIQSSAKVLTAGGYYLSIELFSNSGGDTIRVWDDETVTNPSWSSIVYIPGTSARWYTNGNNFMIGASLSNPVTKTSSLSIASNALYPNPVTSQSKLEYSLNTKESVTITIRDIQGRIMQQIPQGTQNAGRYTVSLDGSVLSNGIYLVEIQAGASKEVIKFSVAH
jgi:hypothetical protein